MQKKLSDSPALSMVNVFKNEVTPGVMTPYRKVFGMTIKEWQGDGITIKVDNDRKHPLV